MSDADWPSPEPAQREAAARPAPLPRLEDLPVAEQGYDREKVREAFDAFYRHAAQLDATLRTLEAVEVFQRTAAELRAELRTVRGAGWTVQSWQGYAPRARVTEWSLPPAFPRIALEALFLIVVGVIVGVAGWSRVAIVAVMGVALALVWLIELLAARERAIPAATAAAAAPVLDEPEPAVEASAALPAEEGFEAMTIFDERPAAVQREEPREEPLDEATDEEAAPALAAAVAPQAPVEVAEAEAEPVAAEAEPVAADTGTALEDGADEEPLAAEAEVAAVAEELEPAPAVEPEAIGGGAAEVEEAQPRRRRFRLFRRRAQAVEALPTEPAALAAEGEEPEPAAEAVPVEREEEGADAEVAAEAEPAVAEAAPADEVAHEPADDLAPAPAVAEAAPEVAEDGYAREVLEPDRAEPVAEAEPAPSTEAAGPLADAEEAPLVEPEEVEPAVARVDPWEQEPELPAAALGADDAVEVAAPAEPRRRFPWFRRDRGAPSEPAPVAAVETADEPDAPAAPEPERAEVVPEPDESPEALEGGAAPGDVVEPSTGEDALEQGSTGDGGDPLEPEPQDLPVDVLAEQAAAALERSRARRRTARRGRRR